MPSRTALVPLGDVPEAVAGALAGLDGSDDRKPTVKVIAVGTEGAEVTVTVVHPPDVDVVPTLLARLRDRFPEASVTVGRS